LYAGAPDTPNKVKIPGRELTAKRVEQGKRESRLASTLALYTSFTPSPVGKKQPQQNRAKVGVEEPKQLDLSSQMVRKFVYKAKESDQMWVKYLKECTSLEIELNTLIQPLSYNKTLHDRHTLSHLHGLNPHERLSVMFAQAHGCRCRGIDPTNWEKKVGWLHITFLEKWQWQVVTKTLLFKYSHIAGLLISTCIEEEEVLQLCKQGVYLGLVGCLKIALLEWNNTLPDWFDYDQQKEDLPINDAALMFFAVCSVTQDAWRLPSYDRLINLDPDWETHLHHPFLDYLKTTDCCFAKLILQLCHPITSAPTCMKRLLVEIDSSVKVVLCAAVTAKTQ